MACKCYEYHLIIELPSMSVFNILQSLLILIQMVMTIANNNIMLVLAVIANA